MPLMLGMLRYIAPSLPFFVSPQHWFAGNGGLPRVVYLADVCLTHRPLRDPDLALGRLVLDAALGRLDRPFDRVLGISFSFFARYVPMYAPFFLQHRGVLSLFYKSGKT